MGAAAVINDAEEVIGIITDGDIRRMLEKYENIASLIAQDIMGKNPKTIDVDELAPRPWSLCEKIILASCWPPVKENMRGLYIYTI